MTVLDRVAPLDLSVCEAEEIRTTGRVKAYGCLLVLGEPDGDLEGCSANASVMLGRPVAAGRRLDEALGHAVWPEIQKAMACDMPACNLRLVSLAQAAPLFHQRFESLCHRSDAWLIVEFVPRHPVPAVAAPTAQEAKGVALQWARPDAPVIAVVDQTAVRQIAINLINNAVKFTAKGGTVTVALARLLDGGLSFSVADTGIGIPAEAIGRLFQPFSQIDSGRDRRLGGAGLGLSIVRSLAQLHGGAAEAQSVEGKGTTFKVSLPAWRIEAAI